MRLRLRAVSVGVVVRGWEAGGEEGEEGGEGGGGGEGGEGGKEGEEIEGEEGGDGVVLCFDCVVLLGCCGFVLVVCGVARETVVDFSPVTLVAHLRAPLCGGVPAAPPYLGVARVVSVLVCLA